MLVLRRDQLLALNSFVLGQFKKKMREYLTKHFSDVCIAKGDPAVMESIQEGVDRAAKHGITIEYDVARFIALTYLLSWDYETMEGSSWVSPILKNPNLGSHLKMNELWALANKKLGEMHTTNKRGN